MAAQGTMIKSLCSLVSKVKNVSITILAKYLDYTNILVLTIILLIWPSKSPVQDIQVFLGFANFYWWFIEGFSRIAASFILILKTSGSTESIIRPKKGEVGVDGNGKAKCNNVDDVATHLDTQDELINRLTN